MPTRPAVRRYRELLARGLPGDRGRWMVRPATSGRPMLDRISSCWTSCCPMSTGSRWPPGASPRSRDVEDPDLADDAGGPTPETKARLNGNVQVVLERGEEALARMPGWLGRASGRTGLPPDRRERGARLTGRSCRADDERSVASRANSCCWPWAILVPAGYESILGRARLPGPVGAWRAAPTTSAALMLLDRHLPDGDGSRSRRRDPLAPFWPGRPILLVSASVLPRPGVAAAEPAATASSPSRCE